MNAHVIQLVAQSAKISLDVSQAFSIGQLSKSHNAIMIGTAGGLDLVIASVTLNNGMKTMLEELSHQLRKYRCASVHIRPPGDFSEA